MTIDMLNSSILTRGTSRRGITVSVFLACLATAFGEQLDVITKPAPDSANIIKWRIDRPNVKQRTTDYPTITFKPGDFVTVTAGGCAQTGGHGKTWKRYVDPQGPNEDRLYHGLISIPGITRGLVRIKDFEMRQEHQIPANTPANDLYLQLGYEDDGYGDNGYWGRDGDDGTDGQCKGLPDAYVLLAIRRGGNAPVVAASLVEEGIPHSSFRVQGAWQFHNFNTATLSWDSFTDAFDIGWTDRLNPITYVEYIVGRYSLAAKGNCAGMCILACAGEKEWALEDNLVELFWPTFTQYNPIQHDINVCHWKQLSTYFLKKYMHSMFDSPTTIASEVEKDIQNKQYGLLCMSHGWEGHVVVPLSVERPGGNAGIIIHLYDPDSECAALPDNEASHTKLTINGDSWSFPNLKYTQADGHLAYVPYVIDNGWRELANGLGDAVQIVLGDGASVEQITDSTGKQLFSRTNPRGLQDVDGSNRGLGHDITKMVVHGADVPPTGLRPIRKPKFTIHKTLPETPQEAQLAAQKVQEYEREYGRTREVYFVMNHDLRDLKIQVSSPRTAGNQARLMVGNHRQYYELKTQAADNKQAINPDFVIHSIADLSSGVALYDRQNVAHKATFIAGLFHQDQNEMHVHTAAQVNAGKTIVEVRMSPARALGIHTAGQLEETQVESHAIDARGAIKQLGSIKARMQSLRAP